jgi:hypothetical protein
MGTPDYRIRPRRIDGLIAAGVEQQTLCGGFIWFKLAASMAEHLLDRLVLMPSAFFVPKTGCQVRTALNVGRGSRRDHSSASSHGQTGD